MSAIRDALKAYNQTLQDFRQQTIDNGFDPNQLQTFTLKLKQQRNDLASAASIYRQIPGKDPDKLQVVQAAVEMMDGPLTPETHLLNAVEDLIRPPYIQKLTQIQTNTASVVYKADASRRLGTSSQAWGFAKKELSGNDLIGATVDSLLSSYLVSREGTTLASVLGVNQKTTTLAQLDRILQGRTDLKKAPSLLLRQVLSSRIDKALGLNVIADEVFAPLHVRDPQTQQVTQTPYAISSMASGKQAMKEVPNGGDVISVYQWFPLTLGKLQKSLSDLQIMDAITGQLDRRLANLFIDHDGKVTGIDNDMAFGYRGNDPSSRLTNQFERDPQGRLVYRQNLIDAVTAEKVLAMNEAEFRRLLQGRPDDPARLADESDRAIEMAVERFGAVQDRIRQLKAEGKLITEWNDRTYQAALSETSNPSRSTNYLYYLHSRMEGARTDPKARLVL